jgi:anti-sigma regulatory factor (Ser/Thr protein kinase)
MMNATYHDSPAAPGQARHFVAGALRRHGVCEGPMFEAALLVISELVTNAVIHAKSDVDLVVDIAHGSFLRLEVADNSDSPPRRGPSIARGADGGLGLNVVNDLVLDWGIAERCDGARGKVVWAELLLVP